MPTMPDSEAGHILTNLYGASLSGQSRSPSTTQYQTSDLHQHQTQHQSSVSGFKPIAQSPKPQETSPPPKRSRSRPTKSCEQCRRKKLKCNRELPCSQCLKGGRDGRQCHFEYGPEAGERDGGRDEGMDRGLKRFRMDIEEPRTSSMQPIVQRDDNGSARQIAHQYFKAGDVHPSHPPPSIVPGRPQGFFGNYATYATPESIPPPTTTSALSPRSYVSSTLGRIHVKGSGSRYVGYSDRMAMLDQFEESKDFILGSFKDPEMSGMIQELAAFHRAFHPKHGKCKTKVDELPDDREILVAQMLLSVPSEYQLATLQEKYVVTWETISRVLHIPTFAKDCAAIAAVTATGGTTLPSHIGDWVLPQVLCVVSIASRLYDPNDKAPLIEKTEEQSRKDIAMIQKWLDGIYGKQHMNLHHLETRVLLLQARHANMCHPSELWRECGDIVRRAMLIGLHQDPEGAEKLSKMQKEMRRKLWITIVELDLRFSLSAGMPSAVQSSLVMVAEIVNVDDEELTEDMAEYPMYKPNTVWTHALPQIALVASIKERLDVTNLLGGYINIEKDAPLILQHARILENVLKSLPTQFRSSTKAGNISNKQLHRLFTSIMLDISIRRPLLSLYRVIAMSPISAQYPEAMTGALRNSLAILAHLDALDPTVGDISTVKTRDYLNLFHILCKMDIMQAATVLCYQIRSFNSSLRSSESTEEEAGNDHSHFLEGQTKQSLTRVVENTLNSMLQRISEFGSDLKDVLPLSVLLQSVRADGTADERKAIMLKGAERVLLVCRQILPGIQDAVQQNNPRFGRYKQNMSPAPSTPNWNPPPVQNSDLVENGALSTFNDIDFTLGDDLLSQNFDFGFSDWDINQSWL